MATSLRTCARTSRNLRKRLAGVEIPVEILFPSHLPTVCSVAYNCEGLGLLSGAFADLSNVSWPDDNNESGLLGPVDHGHCGVRDSRARTSLFLSLTPFEPAIIDPSEV